MLKKDKAISIVKKWKPLLVKMLRLKKMRITVKVCTHKSQELKKYRGDKFTDLFACCYSSKKSHDIIIFYEHHNNELQLISTLLHELLHVKVWRLASLIPDTSKISVRVEEKLVRDLEIGIMSYIRILHK